MLHILLPQKFQLFRRWVLFFALFPMPVYWPHPPAHSLKRPIRFTLVLAHAAAISSGMSPFHRLPLQPDALAASSVKLSPVSTSMRAEYKVP